MELAKVPETTITVSGEAVTATPPPAPTVAAQVTPAPVQTPAQIPVQAQATTGADTVTASPVWFWVSVFLAVGWILTVLYFFARTTANKPVVDAAELAKQASLNKIISQLRQACMDNDAAAAKNALLDWGGRQFAAGSLGAIAGHCEARLRDEILYLNQVLYGKEAGDWQGKKLFQAFSENKARKKSAKMKMAR